jgi:sugar phosphate isomerase/epimerase
MAELRLGFVVSDQPIEHYLQFAKNNGLVHLEIDLHKEHSLLASFTEKRINSLKAEALKNGLRLSIHPPYTINLAEKTKNIVDQEIVYMKACIELASRLGAEFVTTYLGSIKAQKNMAAARKQAMTRAVKNLQLVIDACEKSKVKLALENAEHLEKDSDLFYVGDCVKDFEMVFKKIDSPWLKLCLDLGHAHVNEGIMKYIDKFSDKIVNVHYHDNDGKTDDHLNIGEGNINWKQVIKAFAKIKYSGPFLSETKDSPAQSKRKLLELIQK